MATYTDIYNLRYGSANLKNRVTVAVAQAALSVLAETLGSTNYDARLEWARRTTEDTPREAERMLWALVTNPTIQSRGEDASDDDIQYVVNELVDRMAKAVWIDAARPALLAEKAL